MVFERLDEKPPDALPLSEARLLEAAGVGMVPLTVHGSTKIVIAPRELTIRNLFAAMGRGSDIRHRVRLTTNARLQRRDPYRWEKTEHGLAKSSRLAQRAA